MTIFDEGDNIMELILALNLTVLAFAIWRLHKPPTANVHIDLWVQAPGLDDSADDWKFGVSDEGDGGDDPHGYIP